MKGIKKWMLSVCAIAMMVCVSGIQVSAAEAPVLGVYVPETDETILAPEGVLYQYKPSVVVYDDGSVLVEMAAFDENGNIVADLWADSQVYFLEYQLDEKGSRVVEDMYLGNAYYLSAYYAYEYNDAGDVAYKYQVDENGEIYALYEYEYDVNGKLLSLLYVTSEYQALYEFAYKETGALKTTTVYDSNEDVFETSYGYDDSGRLNTVVKDGEGYDCLFITYDEVGHIAMAETYSYLYGEGDYTSRVQYVYNELGMLELVQVENVNTGQATYKLLY